MLFSRQFFLNVETIIHMDCQISVCSTHEQLNNRYPHGSTTEQEITQTATKTTYELSLHFSQTGTERMSDKVMRLLENFSLCP